MGSPFLRKPKIRIETCINIFMLVLGCLVLFSYARGYFRERALRLHVGDRLPAITNVNWASHDRTLLMVLRNGCHYCEESMPFYRRLTSAIEIQRIQASVVALVPHEPRLEEQVFRAYGLTVPVVGNVPFASLKVMGTPTLLLVDNHAKVRKIWIGQLGPDGEAEVMTSIGIRSDKPVGSNLLLPPAERLNGGLLSLPSQQFHVIARCFTCSDGREVGNAVLENP